MNLKGFGPIIVIVAVLAVLTISQGLFNSSIEPEMLQSQVSGTGTSLGDVKKFELEIELNNNRDIEIRYQTQGERTEAQYLREDQNGEMLSGEEATSAIQVIIESAPSLANTEPLTLIQGILDQLEIHQANLREFDLDYELMDGMERSIELEVDIERGNDDADDA